MDELWSAREFAGVDFGDARLGARLVTLANTFAEKPASSIPEACDAWAETKATYRFFDNDRVSPAKILSAHTEATQRRVADLSVVLSVQDTTTLNFTTHHNTKGLGPIGKAGLQGFFLHSALAVSGTGVPLGLLAFEFLVRPEADSEGKKRTKTPPEERESARWQRVLLASTQKIPPGVPVITVADREADYYDFLAAAVRSELDILIRAKHDRRLVEEGNPRLREKLQAIPPIGATPQEIPRSGERSARTATLEFRAAAITFFAPGDPEHKGAPPLSMWALLAQETSPVPEGEEPVDWLLLTTMPIPDFTCAQQLLLWYTYRWRIERFHYTLKSGCQTEKLQLETRERIERAVAVYAVVAWRLQMLTYLSRTVPDAPCTTVLCTSEWQALFCRIHKTANPPTTPPDLKTAVRWIARLEGFLGRRHDGDPGVKVLWRGFRALYEVTVMWEIFRSKS